MGDRASSRKRQVLRSAPPREFSPTALSGRLGELKVSRAGVKTGAADGKKDVQQALEPARTLRAVGTRSRGVRGLGAGTCGHGLVAHGSGSLPRTVRTSGDVLARPTTVPAHLIQPESGLGPGRSAPWGVDRRNSSADDANGRRRKGKRSLGASERAEEEAPSRRPRFSLPLSNLRHLRMNSFFLFPYPLTGPAETVIRNGSSEAPSRR